MTNPDRYTAIVSIYEAGYPYEYRSEAYLGHHLWVTVAPRRCLSITCGPYAYSLPRKLLQRPDMYTHVEVGLLLDDVVFYSDTGMILEHDMSDVLGRVPVEELPALAIAWAEWRGLGYVVQRNEKNEIVHVPIEL